MKNKIKFFIGAVLVFISVYYIAQTTIVRAEAISSNTESVQEVIDAVESTIVPTPTPEAETTEYDKEIIPEESPTFDTSIYKIFDYQTATKKEYLEAPLVGLIEIQDSNIETALRYGTQYEENIDAAAGITEFSTDERLYILGHNLRNGSIFHNLIETQEGEEVKITLVNEGKIAEYSFEVCFTQRYTEEEYEANNFACLTNNKEYDGEYDLVLVTCNHRYVNGIKESGRQVVLCQLTGE